MTVIRRQSMDLGVLSNRLDASSRATTTNTAEGHRQRTTVVDTIGKQRRAPKFRV
jgi:hypothetical protein